MRYIEVDLIITQIKEEYCTKCKYSSCGFCDIDDILLKLEEADDADVVEVKYGEWIEASDKPYVAIGKKCSLCGARIKYSEFYHGTHLYCHKCGAKMDGGLNG